MKVSKSSIGNVSRSIVEVDKIQKNDEDYSTLWEYWDKGGTMKHVWSGGPLITMAKYIAGIRPADVAYGKVDIKPHRGKLKYIKCCVPSVRGAISIQEVYEKDNVN